MDRFFETKREFDPKYCRVGQILRPHVAQTESWPNYVRSIYVDVILEALAEKVLFSCISLMRTSAED